MLSAAERFFDSSESGKPELQSTFAAAKEFLKGYKNSPISASRFHVVLLLPRHAALAANTPNAAAMEAFINKALRLEMDLILHVLNLPRNSFKVLNPESWNVKPLLLPGTFCKDTRTARLLRLGHPVLLLPRPMLLLPRILPQPPTQQALLAFADEAVLQQTMVWTPCVEHLPRLIQLPDWCLGGCSQ